MKEELIANPFGNENPVLVEELSLGEASMFVEEPNVNTEEASRSTFLASSFSVFFAALKASTEATVSSSEPKLKLARFWGVILAAAVQALKSKLKADPVLISEESLEDPEAKLEVTEDFASSSFLLGAPNENPVEGAGDLKVKVGVAGLGSASFSSLLDPNIVGASEKLEAGASFSEALLEFAPKAAPKDAGLSEKTKVLVTTSAESSLGASDTSGS